MKRWAGCVLVGCGGLVGAAFAQDRGDGSAPGGPPVVSKPAPSRYYGTARPPGSPGAPPAAAPVAPPPSARPPVGAPPPAAYSHGSRPQAPVHSGGRYYAPPPPRVGVDVVIGTPWPRPVYPAYPTYPAYPYWYGPRYYGPRYPYPVYGYPPAVVVPPPVVVSPPPPVVYVERPPEPAAPVPGYWYWCGDPQGWYPNVPECPGGWQPVPPRAEP
jgi:hypothetical protein